MTMTITTFDGETFLVPNFKCKTCGKELFPEGTRENYFGQTVMDWNCFTGGHGTYSTHQVKDTE